MEANKDLKKRYGVAETFTSLQGEGLWAGTPMHFIRFSGCSVGKPLTLEQKQKYVMLQDAESKYRGTPVVENLPVYQEECTLWDGRHFLCDTNFQTAKAMSVEELLAEIPENVERVCLTGGEPLDRDLDPILTELIDKGKTVHIETSGTKRLDTAALSFSLLDVIRENDRSGDIWLAVAPKKNAIPLMISAASELKLLVDENFKPDELPEEITDHPLVWLQPVNFEYELKRENLDLVLGLLQKYPRWRISTQMHKIWRVR